MPAYHDYEHIFLAPCERLNVILFAFLAVKVYPDSLLHVLVRGVAEGNLSIKNTVPENTRLQLLTTRLLFCNKNAWP